MAKVRLKVVAEQLNRGTTTLAEYLNSIGKSPCRNPSADDLAYGKKFDSNPLQWLDTKFIPDLIKHFGYIPSEDAVFSVSDNKPLFGSRYLISPLGKKVLLLDGFRKENSETVLNEYKQTFQDGLADFGREEVQTLHRITSLAKSILGDVISDENDFLDCCAYYSCDTSEDRNIPLCLAIERRIHDVISCSSPDLVFILSSSVAMYLDVADGEGPLVRKFLYSGSEGHAEFFYVKDPLRLEKKDFEDEFTIPKDSQVLRQLFNKSLIQPAVKSSHFVKTVFGSAESMTFENCERIFYFLVHEGKIDDTIENMILLTYRLSGKIPANYSFLMETRIVWKGSGCSWDWTLGYFVNKLTGGKYGKPWVIAVNSFCYRGEDKSEPPKEGDNDLLRDEYSNKVAKSSIAEGDPFAERLKAFLLKKDENKKATQQQNT